MIRFLRRLATAGAIGLVLTGIVAGCGSSSPGDATTGSSPSDADIRDGGVLRVGLESMPNSLNPSELVEKSAGMVIQQVAEGLFELGDNGQPVPNLASDYETSADGRTLTIDLRRDVTFSNGDGMTSRDVAFSIEEVKSSSLNGSLFEVISKIRATSPYTVELNLSTPAPGLINTFATYAAYIVPHNYAGVSEKAFAANPIGTGPYVVAPRNSGNAITLTNNSRYWKPSKPHLDEIAFTVAGDENGRLQQVLAGDLNVASATPLGAKTGLQSNSGVRIEETPQRVVNYLLLNLDDPQFQDQRVREAINLAIDREGVVAVATDGRGQPGASFLPPPELFYENLEPPERDVAKAKSLIAEAKAAGNGKVGSPITLRYYNFDEYSRLAAQVLQQDLEEIGLSVKLQPLEEAALNEMLQTGQYEAVLGIYSPAVTDPSGIISLYVAFFSPGAGQDVAAQTKLSEEAATELDEERRAQLYAELQQMVFDEESLLVVNYQPELFAVTQDVVGVELDGAGNLFLRNAGFSE